MSGWCAWGAGGGRAGAFQWKVKPQTEATASMWCWWSHFLTCKVKTYFCLFPEKVFPLPGVPASVCLLGGSAGSYEVRSVCEHVLKVLHCRFPYSRAILHARMTEQLLDWPRLILVGVFWTPVAPLKVLEKQTNVCSSVHSRVAVAPFRS